ncbi:S8 family serine peptidase [Neorhizobium vignae]|uniref:S8 family serine peptidase n=1 Tax=Neorhizobium vignae TaxID=690585 RepID=UPI001267F120
MFSAAGNDCDRGQRPISAKYASPFNWAALEARKRGVENGVIVAAHDSRGKRAYFSNSGGDICCPGVDIMSALAFDGDSKVSTSSYGRMSGTSMLFHTVPPPTRCLGSSDRDTGAWNSSSACRRRDWREILASRC